MATFSTVKNMLYILVAFLAVVNATVFDQQKRDVPTKAAMTAVPAVMGGTTIMVNIPVEAATGELPDLPTTALEPAVKHTDDDHAAPVDETSMSVTSFSPTPMSWGPAGGSFGWNTSYIVQNGTHNTTFAVHNGTAYTNFTTLTIVRSTAVTTSTVTVHVNQSVTATNLTSATTSIHSSMKPSPPLTGTPVFISDFWDSGISITTSVAGAAAVRSRVTVVTLTNEQIPTPKFQIH